MSPGATCGGRAIDPEPRSSSARRAIDLEPLLRPRSVAVLGASDRPSPGRMIIESLDRIGFPGQIYPVNPKYETLFGRPCYPSIADLPEAVDLLAVCVNHERVLEHMRPAARRGVRAAIVFDKAVSDDIPHRSELGLVAVGLADERDLTGAWERLSRRLDETGVRGVIAGFLVQEVAQDGLEVFAGVNTDPDWGPVLAFGAGGVLVEALGDVALRPLPLRDGDAEAMIAETRAGALLAGYRGRPPGDLAALTRCLSALADFAWAERHSLAEIDVNPIVVSERG